MGRLKAIPPRLRPVGDRLRPVVLDRQAAEAQRLKDRDRNVSWRSWYGSARWKALRAQVWKRDKYVCQRSGVVCIGKYPAPDSPVANHKIKHDGDPVLFWDPDNIETVAKSVHDAEIQAEERRAALGVGR